MSIAKFKATNHPQQTAKRGAVDEVDDRGTDETFYRELNQRFGFTLDVAASHQNAKCPLYFDRETNGLEQPWSAHRVWCNPPYSDCRAWVQKAWNEWDRGKSLRGLDRPSLIVMLLPANRVEQGWWQDLVEPFRDKAGSPLRVEFLRGRLRFDRPNAVIGPKGDRPPFGCCLLIWEAS